MSITNLLGRVAASLTILLAVSSVSFADTLRLKDGSIIKGKIVSYGKGKFTVAIGDGSRRREMSFNSAEVDSISFDAGSDATGSRNASYTPPENTSPPTITTQPAPVRSEPPILKEKMRPVELTARVTADNTANGWTNTGFVVRKGQRIRISAQGEVSLGSGKTAGAGGSASIADAQKLLPNVATGALIAVIGDDNNDFIAIGAEREIVATRDGALFLGINEGHLEDNAGAFDVKVRVMPDAN